MGSKYPKRIMFRFWTILQWLCLYRPDSLVAIIRILWHAVKFFSKLNYFIFGYFDPNFFFWIIQINIFWGDVSGISAKTATLVACFIESGQRCVLCRSTSRSIRAMRGSDLRRVWISFCVYWLGHPENYFCLFHIANVQDQCIPR